VILTSTVRSSTITSRARPSREVPDARTHVFLTEEKAEEFKLGLGEGDVFAIDRHGLAVEIDDQPW
jgi:hypothetical protein